MQLLHQKNLRHSKSRLKGETVTTLCGALYNTARAQKQHSKHLGSA